MIQFTILRQPNRGLYIPYRGCQAYKFTAYDESSVEEEAALRGLTDVVIETRLR